MIADNVDVNMKRELLTNTLNALSIETETLMWDEYVRLSIIDTALMFKRTVEWKFLASPLLCVIDCQCVVRECTN